MTFMELKTAPHLLIFVIVYFGVMVCGKTLLSSAVSTILLT